MLKILKMDSVGSSDDYDVKQTYKPLWNVNPKLT